MAVEGRIVVITVARTMFMSVKWDYGAHYWSIVNTVTIENNDTTTRTNGEAIRFERQVYIKPVSRFACARRRVSTIDVEFTIVGHSTKM